MSQFLFLKDFTKIFSGALAAQIIGLSLSPVLSRIYDPEEFGLFSLFTQVVAPISVLSSLSLPFLVPRFKDNKEAIFKVLFSSTMTVCLVILFLELFFGFGSYLFPKNSNLLYWTIFGVFLTNTRSFFHMSSLTDGLLVKNSISRTMEAMIGGATNIGLGIVGLGTTGLILGNLTGQSLFIIFTCRSYKELLKRFLIPRRENNVWKGLVLNNKKHLVFQTLNHLLDFSLVLIFFIIVSKHSSLKDLGYFAFYLKIINGPLLVCSNYFSQTVLKRIFEFKYRSDLRSFFIKANFLVVLPAISLYIIISNFGVEIFTITFGEKWAGSGLVATEYLLASLSTFYIRCFQFLPNLKNRQEIYTIFSLITFGAPVAFLYYSMWAGKSFIESLMPISVTLLAIAFLYALLLYFFMLQPARESNEIDQ